MADVTIYIVRHGETALNNDTDTSQDRVRGWKDVPLVETGREEARKAGAKLKGKEFGSFYASDLSRAAETAQIIGEIIGMEPVMSEKLRPWNLGTFAGKTTKEALPKIGEYVRKKPDEPVPQGESFNEFKTRAFEGFREAAAGANGKSVLLVTHHRDERLLEAWNAAGQPANLDIDLDTFLEKGDPPGGIKVLETTDQALAGSKKKKATKLSEPGILAKGLMAYGRA